MKKLLITITIVSAFITTSAQSTLHSTTTIGNTINQPYTNILVKQLANGYEVRKMQLPFTDTVAEYTVQKIGHDYIMDGDIVVGNDLAKTQSYSIGSGIYKDSYKWKDGEIPIVIDNSIYMNNMEASVFDAIDELNNKLCLKFIFRTTQKDYVKITVSDSKQMGFAAGRSSIGRQGNDQVIELLKGIRDKGVLLHEMLHTLGVFHEMSRSDRDLYIRINEDNIKKEARDQFNTVPGLAVGEFDFCSIMLYGQHTSANINENAAWDRIDKDKNIIALPACTGDTYSTLSDKDIIGITKIYGTNEPSKIKVDRNNLPPHLVTFKKNNKLVGEIEWRPETGMPNGAPEDMFIINLQAYTAFDETAPFNDSYIGSNKRGHFINLKNVGRLEFSKIENASPNSYKSIVFTIYDIPEDVPYIFSVELNPKCQWIGTTIPSPTVLTTYEPILTITNELYTKRIPANSSYNANIKGEITGMWSRKPTIVNTIDPKIVQPKPGDPVANPAIKSPVRSGTVQQPASPVIIKKTIIH